MINVLFDQSCHGRRVIVKCCVVRMETVEMSANNPDEPMEVDVQVK